jgi:hypothetical protein
MSIFASINPGRDTGFGRVRTNGNTNICRPRDHLPIRRPPLDTPAGLDDKGPDKTDGFASQAIDRR